METLNKIENTETTFRVTRNIGRCRFATIRCIAHEIEAALEGAAPRAQVRCLASDDIETALRAHRKAVQTHSAANTRVYGGFVPNSYRGDAKADQLWLVSTDDGETTVRIERTDKSVSRSFGQGFWLIVRTGGILGAGTIVHVE